jgi:molybdopterin converting factor small subunit
MNVKIKLFATLRDGRFEEQVRRYDPATTVGQVLENLNIPETEVKIVFVNNRHSKLDRELHDGDVVGIFPPIGGG